MYELFRPEPLSARQARLAYPLVRLADPGVTLERWLAFARRIGRRNAQRAGLVVLRNARGYMHALYSYQVEQDARYGARLRVRDLVVGRLPGAALTEAILQSAEALAGSLGCDALLVDVPIPPTAGAHLISLDQLPSAALAPASVTYRYRAA